MTQYIKAPFNFVPLNEKVFFPGWADQVSHDIPFSDGESGEIELELEAMTPVFVRNGHTQSDAETKNDEYVSFSKYANGNYFIPGTSVKGMIRNVLEIMSFGKMNKISNNRYSIRDLQSKEYMNFFQGREVYCGWMKKINEHQVAIYDHGIPRRISHQQLDKIWRTDFSQRFKNSLLLKSDFNRTALYKIELANGKNFVVRYSEKPMNEQNSVDKRVRVIIDSQGEFEGTIVLTGQSSARKDKGDKNRDGSVVEKGSCKCFEFVFPNKKSKEPFILEMYDEQGLYKDFDFIHKESIDWKYWKRELFEGKSVPVFFVKESNKLMHFGLTNLYRLPFQKRIKEYLPSSHNEHKHDLADCIFGCTTLKGRVQFSNFSLQKGKIHTEILKPYMGSPKPTYYPIYVVQNGNNGYPSKLFNTMLHENAKLKGWKRYPVHSTIKDFKLPEGFKEEKLSPFCPIETGSKFKGTIRFHNLKKAEIGALINSLTLKNEGFHSVGFAKAYGFGKIQIKITKNKEIREPLEEYSKAFELLMSDEIPDYLKSNELKEFKLMSKPQETKVPLEYMPLPDFIEHKRQKVNHRTKELEKTGQFLEYYSNLIVKRSPDENPQKEFEAIISFVQKPIIKATLCESKDLNSKLLEDVPAKISLKKGDKIWVKKVMKGGNIKSLSFVRISK